MDAPRLPPAVLAAASDRAGGALEVAATALDGLLEVARDRELLEEAVRVLEAGQPAMAPIWHLATAARSPDPRSALAALGAGLAADADAAVEAATTWLLARLATHPGGAHPGAAHPGAYPGAVATVSHSSLVDRVLDRLGPLPTADPGARFTRTRRNMGPLHGRVAEPGGGSPGLSTAPTGADPTDADPTGADPTGADPTGAEGAGAPTTPPGPEGAGSSTAAVVGVVGADAIGPVALLNADGTRELAGRVPTLVVATAVKLVPAAVFGRLGGPGFEVVPLEALAAVVVGSEVLSPAQAGRRARELAPG
jgi:hypothetical protein